MDLNRARSCVDQDSSIPPNSVFRSSLLRPLVSTSVNVQSLLVGRPGLDPGTLRVFPERPRTSISVQICWPHEVQCPPTSTGVLSRLKSWLDNWLDLGSFQGQVTIQYRAVDGEELDLCIGGGERRTTDPLHAIAALFTSLMSAGDGRRFDYWAFN
jgi:hypothetical protein